MKSRRVNVQPCWPTFFEYGFSSTLIEYYLRANFYFSNLSQSQSLPPPPGLQKPQKRVKWKIKKGKLSLFLFVYWLKSIVCDILCFFVFKIENLTEIGLWSRCETSYRSGNVTEPFLMLIPKTRECQLTESRFIAKIFLDLAFVSSLVSVTAVCIAVFSIGKFSLKISTCILGLNSLFGGLFIVLFLSLPFDYLGTFDLSFYAAVMSTFGSVVIFLRFRRFSTAVKKHQIDQNQNLLQFVDEAFEEE